MKICGIICEFNPFHNGHEYVIRQARMLSGCDLLICVMSGYFTQRGDIAVCDKYARARHAVLGGADCVIELPAAFATAPAEVFAKGAVKILGTINDFTYLSFGCEMDDDKALKSAANILDDETETFSKALSEGLKSGLSFAKSREAAFEAAGGQRSLLISPNNILAVEYVRALKKLRPEVITVPVKRVGGGYNDTKLNATFSSASAIRKNYPSPEIGKSLPEYSLRDLGDVRQISENYGRALKLILSRTTREDLKTTFGCGEGLENLLKSLENLTFEEIISGATSKRYAASRIKRILCENLLGVHEEECKKFLAAPLYITPLAVKKERADEVFKALSRSEYPVITSGSNELTLENEAKSCKALDNFAQSQWRQITQLPIGEKLVTV